ncbi:hypothetical protein CYMTET_3301, partial [Cymbomonas tetramitiformis]
TKESKAKESGNNEKGNGESANVVSQSPPPTLETELPNRKLAAASISMAAGDQNDLCTNPLFQDLEKQEESFSDRVTDVKGEESAQDWSRQQSW